MAWVKVNADSILAPASNERKAIAAIRQRDDLQDYVDEAVSTFRGAIQSRGYPLGPEGTIPEGIRHYVCGMALWHFITEGVPENEGIQTKARRAHAEEAEKKLNEIREGKLAVELPAGVTASSQRTGNWNSEHKIIMRHHPIPDPAVQYPSAVKNYANPDGPADS